MRTIGSILITLALAAQVAASDLVITNARVVGEAETVHVVVRGGTIRAIGRQVRAPRSAPQVDAKGAWLLPGRIDAWATLPGGSPLGRALDGFDGYDDDARREAWRNGVTTVCLTPDRGFEGACGTAQVVKLRPGARDSEGLVLVEESAVCAGLGSLDEAPTVRARRFAKLDDQLRDAARYAAAWAEYDEALGEYVEAIAKIDSGTKAADGKGKAKGKGGDAGGKDAGGKGGKDAPKRPKEPKTIRLMALLARVLDGELPLRIEAQRAADVANALALQAAHGFELILEGGAEAYLLAADLERDRVHVVLGQALQTRPPGGEPLEYNRDRGAPQRDLGWARVDPARHTLTNAAQLAAHEVGPVLGSGSWARSRFLAVNAALAVSGGLDAAAAEAAITSRAAELLGLSERLGTVAVGYEADLVLQDDLVDGAVRLTVVDGAIVYRKDG